MRQSDGEEGIVDMCLMDELYHVTELLGLGVGEVMILMDVGGQVVEMAFAMIDDELPVALSDAYLAALVELPIQIVVLLLLLVFTEQGGKEGNAVPIFFLRLWDALIRAR